MINDFNVTIPNLHKVYTIEDLQKINNDLTANYVLMNDIDAQCTHEWNKSKGFNPIGNLGSAYNEFYFTGTFFCQDYSIKNIYINRPKVDYIGLFAGIGDKGKVHNLKLVNPEITGKNEVGALVANPDRTAHCLDCAVIGGSVTGTGKQHIGGFTGSGCGSFFTRCSSTAKVVGLAANEVGGFTGDGVGGTFTDCYSTGNVIGSSKVGGFCGKATGFFIKCYSTGKPKTNSITEYVGGFGGFGNGSYKYCFWDKEASGMNRNFSGAIGKTTKEMMIKKTFTNYDFKTVWKISENKTYPTLRKKKLYTTGIVR